MNIFQTSKGAQIYQQQLHEFPGLVGNVYFVVVDGYRVLIDTGSGFGESNLDLIKGFEEISKIRNEENTLSTLTHIFLTHGHIDHFGGLPFILERSDAKVCIHELDRMIVSNHEERLLIAGHRLEEFLGEAGVPNDMCKIYLDMYKVTKSLFRSVRVDHAYESACMSIGPFKFTHVPGHSAGHVVIQLDDVLFTGDHILEKTSPHQAPEQITLSTGIDTYLKSLNTIYPIAKSVSYALGGHENPIYNIENRISEIRSVHIERLQKILDYLENPHTIIEVSRYLFGKVNGYTILLAIEETGAHIEYLYQRGYIKINNLTEIEANSKTVPKFYVCVDCGIKLH